MKVLPNDTIARGLGWSDSGYITPPLLRWGTGKYLAYVLGPDDYWDSDFWNQFQMAIGHEVEILLRLLSFLPSSVTQMVLDGTYPDDLESVLSASFPQTITGTRIATLESFLGIPTDTTQTDTTRRSTILNQTQNEGLSPTVQYITNLVQKYVISAVILDENALPAGTHDNSFIVRIISPVGVPSTDSLLRAALDTFKPATLAYTIQYTETDFVHLAERDFVTLGETDFSTMNY